MLARIQKRRGDLIRKYSDDHKLYRDFKNINIMNYDKDAINSAVRNILETRIGSLPGKPTFGSDLYKIPFSQLDYITENTMKISIKDALDIWEPRIVVTSVEIKKSEEYNLIQANITYRYRYNGNDINDEVSVQIKEL